MSQMALDYLSIPGMPYLARTSPCPVLTVDSTATSVDVERTFSRGRRLITHVRSRLSAQSTRAVLCLGDWVKWDLVRAKDIRAVAKLDEVIGDEDDYLMDDGWDRIGTVLKGSAQD